MAEESNNKSKKKKFSIKLIAIVIAIVLLFVFILAGAINLIIKVTFKGVSKASKQYTHNVTINADGSVSTAISAQELWENLLDQGYDIDSYLKGPEELEMLMNAELVTQLPDTRSNVEKSIDWDAVFANASSAATSANWAGDEPEYIEHMRKKLEVYDSETNYGCLVDCDNCRLTIFKKVDGKWVLEVAWNAIVGVNAPGGSGEKTDWPGPRSRSFKGAWKVIGKVEQSNAEVNYAVCYVECKHGAYTDDCQRFEYTGYGDPDKMDVKDRYCTAGCCGLTMEHELWIYEHIPIGTTVVVFDKYNPMPGWKEGDTQASIPDAPKSKDVIVTDTNPEPLTEEEKAKISAATSNTSITSGSGNISNLKGIIKFKRHDENGNEYYLTYANPTLFQNQVEIYNKSGSEDARNFVMTHFTLKENPRAGTSGTIYGTGSFTKYNLTNEQLNTLARICQREQGSAKGAAAEASLMANLFELSGSSFGNGADGLYNYVMNSGWFGIPGDHNAPSSPEPDVLQAVEAVLVKGYRTLPKYVNEHDCLNPPDIIDPPARREDFIPFQTVLHNIYGSTYTFYSFPTEDSDPFGYTSEENRQKYGDFCYEYGSWTAINGTEDTSLDDVQSTGEVSSGGGSGNVLKWPTDGTTITSTFGPRSAPIAGASTNHGAIDIGVPEGTNVYACEEGTITALHPNHATAGNWVEITHQNGYVTWYMHNSQFKVKEGDRVQKGQVIALSGNTGNSTGPHLHFEVHHNDEKVDPLTFKYSNGMGSGTGGFGVSSSEVSGSGSTSGPPANYTGQLDYSQSGDGYGSVYTSSAGLTFRNYKQYEGSYSENKYRYDNIRNVGCLPTSMSIIASGLGREDLTPDVIASRIDGDFFNNAINYMNELGWNPEKIDGPSADTLLSKVRAGNVLIVYADAGSAISWGNHYSTVVDVNDKGEVFILNPGIAEGDSRGYVAGAWVSAERLVSGGNFFMWAIDSGNAPSSGGSTANTDSSAPGYQAVVGIYKEVDKSLKMDGPNVSGFASEYGIPTDTNPEYTLSTTIVNYEDLVQPYVMKFDFLLALLLTTENKDFVMDIAKLAYNSELEVSIYDTLTVTTDVDNWSYTEATDGKIEGSVGYSGTHGCTYSVEHSHIYGENGALKEEDGYVHRTVVTRTDTVQYALTTADTWFIDYEQTYDGPNYTEGAAIPGLVELPDEDVPEWEEVDQSADTCGKIPKTIQKVVDEVNAAYKKDYDIAMDSYNNQSKSTDSPGNTEMPTQKTIGTGDVTNKAHVYTRKRRVKISDSTSDKTDVTTYTPGPKNGVFKDCNKKELSPNFVTIYNSIKYSGIRNVLEISWLLDLLESDDSLSNITEIFKYLYYKATGQNLGVTELDVTNYYPGELNRIGGNSFAGSDLLQVAQKCIEYLDGWTYSQCGHTMPLNEGGQNTVDCSSYVCWVLYEYGYKSEFAGSQKSSGDIGPYTQSLGWQQVSASSAQPGDILVRSKAIHGSGHVEIYAGNNESYNGGQTMSIGVVTPGKTSTAWGSPGAAEWDYAIRVPSLSGGNVGVSSSGNSIGYVSQQAANLIYYQQRSGGGATGTIDGSKKIECGWCSLSHALILVTGNYSLTPESIAQKATAHYGKNWTTKRSYNLYLLKDVASTVFDRKTETKQGLNAESAKNILAKGGVIIVSKNKNVNFYNVDGTTRKTSNGHTIVIYKYENGYFYAKDSTNNSNKGGPAIKYPESYISTFMNGTNLIIY